MTDAGSRRVQARLRQTMAICALLLGVQLWVSWPRPLTGSGLYLVSRPPGAWITVHRKTWPPTSDPPVRSPGPVPLQNRANTEVWLELPGYEKAILMGRELAFERNAQGAMVAKADLQPRLPVLVPLLYTAWSFAPLLLAALAGLAFWRWTWRPYRRMAERQAGLRRRLVQGEVVEGVRLGSVELGSLLGQGGMGAVYQARSWESPTSDWPLAVKLLTGEATVEARERFLREAEVCRRLDHPGIVRLLDWGELDGQLYLVMERVPGAPLSERLQQGAATLTEVLDWARQLASALAYAHQRELVHRDIKPSNLMLTPAGRLVVMDFGIAHRADLARLTQAGDALGTPGYMALEQLRGQGGDFRADLYAYGVLLYEALGGRRPFEGASLMELIGRQINADFPPLATLAPNAPSELRELVERLLSPIPEQRADDPLQVSRELERIHVL